MRSVLHADTFADRPRRAALGFTEMVNKIMKQLIIGICGIWCGCRLMATGPLIPDTFLTQGGMYQGTNSGVVRELTIQTNKLWLVASKGPQSSSAGSYNWAAANHWFVYVAEDMRIWAYNGERFFILLEANAQAAHTVTSEHLQETPPGAVMKRLPRYIRKSLPAHEVSAPYRGGSARRTNSPGDKLDRWRAVAGLEMVKAPKGGI